MEMRSSERFLLNYTVRDPGVCQNAQVIFKNVFYL